VTLAKARAEAKKALGKVADAIDPAALKKEAREAAAAARADTFESVARGFVKRRSQAEKSRSWRQDGSRLGFGFEEDGSMFVKNDPVLRWAKRPIAEIKRRDVNELLDSIKDDGRRVMASNVFAVLRKLSNWAVSRDIVANSPCVGVETDKVVARDRVLTDGELKALWEASAEVGYPFGDVTKLLILTGQRRDEVAGMKRSELDLERRMWTVPAARAKNNKVHDVPLSDAAVAVIEALPKVYSPEGLLFTTNSKTPVSGFSKAKKELDDAMPSKTPPWVLHDIRRTVATGMQKLNIALPVTEAVLNHVSGSRAGIVGVYQRHDYADEKRSALQAWANYLANLIEPRASNVASFPQGANRSTT
jgi:integrase